MKQIPNEHRLIVVPESSRPALNPGFAVPMPETELESSSVPFSHYLWILKRHLWAIAAFVIACVSATVIISSRLEPVYESTVTVDIDRQSPTGVVGQESTQSTLHDSDQFMATQIKMIQSDSVLRPVAENYELREREGQLEDLGSHTLLDAEEAPIVLKNLKVTRPPNTYLLQISYRSTDPHLASDVANDVAKSYLEHTYNIRIRSSANMSTFMERQLAELKAKMERSGMALSQFEKELNVINPEEKTSILSSRLLQLNTEYTGAQAERVRKEAAHNSVSKGSLEAAQVSSQGEDLRALMSRQNQARERFAEVQAHFGSNHPEYRKADAHLTEVQLLLNQTQQNIGRRIRIEYEEAVSRERMLAHTIAKTKSEFDRLNARSYEYQALKREAEGDKDLYEELVRKIKEAGINASFQNSNIRIADAARPALKPVFPNTPLNAVLAFVLSMLLAIGAAILSDMLDSTVRDPEQVARTMNTEVVGSLPSVKVWKGRLGLAPANPNQKSLVPTGDVTNQSVSGYEEAVRTLRNSILLTDFDRRVRSMLVTSATPSEGKSTTAAHLAISHAEQGNKTLLIDGDLRRPSVHRRFKISGVLGLSNVLVAEHSWKDLLQTSEQIPNLSILPAGPPSRRASDLVGQGLAELLEEAAIEFDLVILDAPPLLGFAEPLQMATAVDGVLVVAKAGQTDRHAIASVVATLHRLRANVIGVVLNEVRKEMSNSYYYYNHYGKYYRPATQS